MSLPDFNNGDSEEEESATYWSGKKRPIVDEEIHLRVDRMATKMGIDNKEAYSKILRNVVDEEGNIKPKAKGIFAYND